MCKQTITFNLEDFTEEGYLKAKDGYLGIKADYPIKCATVEELKFYNFEPIVKPIVLSRALDFKKLLEATPKETKLHDTKCGKCCALTCGLFNPAHKECHCEHDMLVCDGCKHKDICY